MLKAWASDVGCEVSSIGVQVHGGMGFVEETGAAQHYRDARIAPIYEGTNGIQAMDLVTRKLDMASGAPFASLMGDVSADCSELPGLAQLAEDCLAVGKWMLNEASLDDRLAGSVPFCTMCATAVAGWQLARQVTALKAGRDPRADLKATFLGFFDAHVASAASGLKVSASAGAKMLYDLDSGQLAG
jgi:hypothetical protein